MDKINRVLGITNTACALLAGGSAIPLVKEKVKMNHMYGVRFAKTFESDEGNGIPCLVITDREGRILAHSYRGSEYIGPTKPKDLLSSFLTNSKKLRESDFFAQSSN